MTRSNYPLMALVLGLVTTATAHAHVTGATPAHAFTAGLLHPVTGLDHLITALGFGWWATKRTRSSLSRILFLGMVAIGLWIASYWVIPVSIIDTGIIVSLVVIILAATQRPAAPQPAFGLLYGYAHASALPQGQTAYAFIAGMSVTTIGLLALGSYVATAVTLLPGPLTIREAHGAKAIVADSLLMKQQLLIVNRSRRRVSLSLFGVVFGRF
ncbi:MAG: HupE/UreJ family protein [Pseudomonadota bacterium]|nr:HupE/UreJ family protein [Pseudomonadota bacterium]